MPVTDWVPRFWGPTEASTAELTFNTSSAKGDSQSSETLSDQSDSLDSGHQAESTLSALEREETESLPPADLVFSVEPHQGRSRGLGPGVS